MLIYWVSPTEEELFKVGHVVQNEKMPVNIKIVS